VEKPVKKQAFTAALISGILIALVAGVLTVDLAAANFVYQKRGYTNITMQSPQQNQTYRQSTLAIEFTVQTNMQHAYCYTLDGSGEYLTGPIWNDFLKVKQELVSEVVISDDSPAPGYPAFPPYTEYIYKCKGTLPGIYNGRHKITIYGGPDKVWSKAAYYPLFNVGFAVDAPPPRVSVLSPKNQTYASPEVPLDFTVNTPASWLGYSLDGAAAVTVPANATLTGLAEGSHTLVVYAGNTLKSETITFTITTFPTSLVAVSTVAAATAFSFGLVAIFLRRKSKRSDS
jgi:hypothetical protein